MSESKKIAALISAAGLSSRMGDFKPLLPCGGMSIISRVAGNLRRAGAESVVIVTGHRAEEIESLPELEGCIFLRNPKYAESEMFDSLSIGLRALEGHCDKLFISPVDVPAVKPETIDMLLAADGDFVRPMYKGKPGHPILLNAALIPAILSHGGEGGLRGALDALGIKPTDVITEDEGVSMDADTPEDYRYILELMDRI